MPGKSYYIGLISGTSIDAVDCALISIEADQLNLEATLSHPYPPALRDDIFRLCSNNEVPLKLLGETHIAIGLCFASAAERLLDDQGVSRSRVKAIGSHGQTVFHKPESPLPFTLQLGDPATIACRTGIATVADFRSMDMAAGGQGAPLAPLLHHYLFSDPAESRVIVNLGGIANITIIAPDLPLCGYDTGPANVLMDYWIHKQRGKQIDKDGRWAMSGTADEKLLESFLCDAYFPRPEPKSTGREYFNGEWLEQKLSEYDGSPTAEDVQATLLELTAVTVATEIENQLLPDRVFICGGGAHNGALVQRIAELLPQSQVTTTDAIGLPPDWVEAVTFAWLAHRRVTEQPVDSRAVTGATRPLLLGAMYLPA